MRAKDQGSTQHPGMHDEASFRPGQAGTAIAMLLGKDSAALAESNMYDAA